eukprot:11141268-Alexandrium_andersonii.AAC.1
MSASLVGSEMCIRDRTTRSPRGRVPSSAGPLPPSGQSPGGEGRLRSVSYTHLTLPTICSV